MDPKDVERWKERGLGFGGARCSLLLSVLQDLAYSCGGNPCAELQDVHGLSEGSVFRKAAQLMVAS